MAKFHGKTNLHLGEPAWASAEYDHDTRGYVIELDGADADKFRAVAADYGFVESDWSPQAAADAAPAPEATVDAAPEVDEDADPTDEDAESV